LRNGVSQSNICTHGIISYINNPFRVERDYMMSSDAKDLFSPGHIDSGKLCRVVEDDDYTLHAIAEIWNPPQLQLFLHVLGEDNGMLA